jgi:molecular chaperone DnaK
MNEFKDQLDTADKEKVSKLLVELRELAVKGQAADPSVTAEIIKEKIDATQNASLGLFQKVYARLLLHLDGGMLMSFHAGLREEEC